MVLCEYSWVKHLKLAQGAFSLTRSQITLGGISRELINLESGRHSGRLLLRFWPKEVNRRRSARLLSCLRHGPPWAPHRQTRTLRHPRRDQQLGKIIPLQQNHESRRWWRRIGLTSSRVGSSTGLCSWAVSISPLHQRHAQRCVKGYMSETVRWRLPRIQGHQLPRGSYHTPNWP